MASMALVYQGAEHKKGWRSSAVARFPFARPRTDANEGR